VVTDLTRHEFNTDFTWTPPSGTPRLLTEAQLASWNDNGYVLLEDAFDAATLERTIAAIDPYEAKLEAFLRQQKDGKMFIARAGEITFTTQLAAQVPEVRAFATAPVFQGLAHDLVGPDVRLYWDMAVYKKPGTVKPFPWHQDNAYSFVEPQGYVTCWIALSDATLDNGCPWVIPGLHKFGTLAHRTTDLGFVCIEQQPPEAIPVEARAGTIIVMSSLLPHATGANTTPNVRKSFIAQYVREGTVTIKKDQNGALVRTPCTANWQLPILKGGEPVSY
jgi:phytanoyl-CoA hydroxylase